MLLAALHGPASMRISSSHATSRLALCELLGGAAVTAPCFCKHPISPPTNKSSGGQQGLQLTLWKVGERRRHQSMASIQDQQLRPDVYLLTSPCKHREAMQPWLHKHTISAASPSISYTYMIPCGSWGSVASTAPWLCERPESAATIQDPH